MPVQLGLPWDYNVVLICPIDGSYTRRYKCYDCSDKEECEEYIKTERK